MEQSEKLAEEGLVDEAQALLAEVGAYGAFPYWGYLKGGQSREYRWTICRVATPAIKFRPG